jgi:hypothetical protein
MEQGGRHPYRAAIGADRLHGANPVTSKRQADGVDDCPERCVAALEMRVHRVKAGVHDFQVCGRQRFRQLPDSVTSLHNVLSRLRGSPHSTPAKC